MEVKEFAQTATALSAMSHQLRLTIVSLLGQGEVSVQDLNHHLGTSQSNVSQHLAVLWEAGVVRFRKDGNKVFYRLSDHRILQALSNLQQTIKP
jgi:ArsR family transcriptional regulator